MKKVLTILFILVAYITHAQYIPNSAAYQWKGGKFMKSFQIPTACGNPITSINAPDSSFSAFYFDSCSSMLWRFNPTAKIWTRETSFMDTAYQRGDSLYGSKAGVEFLIGNAGSGGGSDSGNIIVGGPFVTENIHIGFDPGTNLTASQVIQQVWYGTKPTATLTGGTTLELTNAANVSAILNWSAKRQVGATTLSTIVITGNSQTFPQTFSQPAAGGTVSGTQDVDVPANITTTYTNTVTAADAQTATDITTFNFLGRKYYGIVSDTTGIGTGSQDAVILALTNTFANTKILATNTGAISGIKFWVYAYPAVLGNLSILTFNAIPAIEAMNTTTRSFTNALGYTQNYIIYWNKQGQTTSSDIATQ